MKFSAVTGGMGPTATTVFFFWKLASMLAEKWNVNHSRCLFWVLCRQYFSLLKFAVMCLWGHWSLTSHLVLSMVNLAYSEGCLESGTLE